jgi:putative copper export protein
LAALAVLVVGRVRRSVLAGTGDDRASPGRVWWIAWGLFGAALLATSSFAGHAAVAEPRALSIANDVVHLLAGATWFTGIVVLAVVLPDGWAGQDAAARIDLLSPAVVRFSRIALIAIGVVAVTGTLNSFLDVAELDDLVDSAYGRTLALKIGLFLAVLALGGINHFFLRARLERARAERDPRRAPGLFRKTIAAELVVALGLMGLSGILVGQARTKQRVVEQPAGPDVSSPRRP